MAFFSTTKDRYIRNSASPVDMIHLTDCFVPRGSKNVNAGAAELISLHLP